MTTKNMSRWAFARLRRKRSAALIMVRKKHAAVNQVIGGLPKKNYQMDCGTAKKMSPYVMTTKNMLKWAFAKRRHMTRVTEKLRVSPVSSVIPKTRTAWKQ